MGYQFTLKVGGVALLGIQPVINGTPSEDAQLRLIRDGEDGTLLQFESPNVASGIFFIELKSENPSQWAMRYWIGNLPTDFVLDSFGIRFQSIENVRAFLRSGYFSWDGSEFVQAEAQPEVVGYAMTQLLPEGGKGGIIVGFDRHDRFQHTFAFARLETALSLTIQTHWDRKTRGAGEDCESERLLIIEREGIEEGLREWARIVAAQSPVPPRRAERITGWCSWYNLYAYITEQNILEHLRGVKQVVERESLPMRVFQIDDGFTPEMGDWLDVKPQFPRGIKPLLDEIRAAGFVPGLWIAPFMVGNRSRLFREHPDWVVLDRASGEPLVFYRFYAEFRWHKRSEEYYVLDATHPEAFEYLHRVFRIWRYEWECEYFKTDFMHFGSHFGPDRAMWHTPGLTRIEVWRRVMDMIREEIGDAVWLGSGCPLWASVGLVDAVRIARDVGVTWQGEHAAQNLLRDLSLRNFANGILWQADPDCVLLRERYHELTEVEVRSLALYAGMSGGVMMTSDALDELSEPRVRLWKFILNARINDCRFPVLTQTDDGVLVQVAQGENLKAVYVFNTSDETVEREFTWNALRVNLPNSVVDWTRNERWGEVRESFKLTLEAHEGALLQINHSK